MHVQENALNDWLNLHFKQPFTLTPLAGDASFRRYYRLHQGNNSFVVMDAPPQKEPIFSFLNACDRLATLGVRTPTVYHLDTHLGFIVLEDLGNQLLLNSVTAATADTYYHHAMDILLLIQQPSPPDKTLPVFTLSIMQNELDLFREWFLQRHLGLSLQTTSFPIVDEVLAWLCNEIDSQPKVLMHRDYHSRNLMVTKEAPHPCLAVIDYQDLCYGPITYDLVSLLKDCYIQWSPQQITAWLTYFYQRSPRCATHWSFAAFERAFHLCGLQRHLKVLGIFCRLHWRDNKSVYLNDLPLTFQYVLSCLEKYEELRPLFNWVNQYIKTSFDKQVQ